MGKYQDFPSKFLSHNAEKKRMGTLSLSLFSGVQKVWMKGWGGVNFPSKISCLTVPKNFVGQTFRVSPFSGIETLYASEGYVTIFQGKKFCLTVPKHFVEEPFSAVFQRISGSEDVYG